MSETKRSRQEWEKKVFETIPMGKNDSFAICTKDIVDQLEYFGFTPSKDALKRRIERILEKYRESNEIVCVIKNKKNYYYRNKKMKPNIESMGTETATAFLLLESHSKDLPEFIKTEVSPWFSKAKASFDDLPSVEKEVFKKIKLTSKFFPLNPNLISKQISESVYRSLKEKRQLFFSYRKIDHPEEDYTVHPLGIDIREKVSYLIASKDGGNNIRIFKMGRITRAKVVEKKAIKPKGFNLNEFIKSDYSRSGTKKNIQVEIFLHRRWWFIFNEYYIANDVTEKSVKGQKDWKLISFTSTDSARLNEWIWGLGEGVVVKSPISLVKTFEGDIKSLLKNYKTLNK